MAIPEFTHKEIETEEWRDVAGYEGIYSVSNLGRVRRNTMTWRGRNYILKPRFTKKGYVSAALSVGGKARYLPVHQLVCFAFVGPRPDGQEPNHLDTNKANNRAWNLEWSTHQDNIDHAVAAGRLKLRNTDGANHWTRQQPERIPRGESSAQAILTEPVVKLIRSLKNDYGLTPTQIRDHLNRMGHLTVSLSAIKHVFYDRCWRHI